MFKKKKKIQNVAQLDLRNYTAEALGKINAISCVAKILLPENPSPEFTAAYAEIEKSCVASEIAISADMKLVSFSGATVLSGAQIPNNSICSANGMTIIYNTENVENTLFAVSGVTIIQKGADIKFLDASGVVSEADIDFDKLKFYSGEITVDSTMIKNLEKDASVAAGGKITIDKDVAEDEIIEKNLTFIAGGEIICSKKIAGCVKARSIVGGRIKENG